MCKHDQKKTWPKDVLYSNLADCDLWLVILRHIWLGNDHYWLVDGEVRGGGGVPRGEGGRYVIPGAGRGHWAHWGGPQLRLGPLEGAGTGTWPLRTLRLILTSWPSWGHPDTRRGQRLETSPEALVTPEHEQFKDVHLDWGLSKVNDGVGVDAIEATWRIFVFPDRLCRLLDLDSTENGDRLRGRGLSWPLRSLESRQRWSGGFGWCLGKRSTGSRKWLFKLRYFLRSAKSTLAGGKPDHLQSKRCDIFIFNKKSRHRRRKSLKHHLPENINSVDACGSQIRNRSKPDIFLRRRFLFLILLIFWDLLLWRVLGYKRLLLQSGGFLIEGMTLSLMQSRIMRNTNEKL